LAGKVLIIEDSRAFGALVSAQIESDLRLPTTLVESKNAAKKLLESHSEEYFVAIVDLNLPDAPRGEAVDVVIKYGLPAIVFTGEISPELHEEFISKGVADYVYKKGSHNLDYVSKLVSRIYKNPAITVLVVSNSTREASRIETLLKIQRFNVIHRNTLLDAKEIASRDASISLAIVDYNSGNEGGPEIVSALRGTHDKHHLGIIGFSTRKNLLASAEFIKNGANDFLSIPYLPEEFYCRVNQAAEVIEQWYQLNDSNEQKNILLGMAAHDIRSPVAVMQSASQRLQKFINDKEKAMELAKMIERNAGSLLVMLTDLLNYSSLESTEQKINLQETVIHDLITSHIQSHQLIAAGKSTTIEYHPKHETMNLAIEASSIGRVLDNLLSNAIKYSPANSVIHIETANNKGFYEINIVDAGPGIKPEEAANLFKPFKRLSSQTTGGESSTGLGLSICDRIVKRHHGELRQKNNSDTGSTFSILLPIP